MRKPDLAMLAACCLFSAWPCAALAENSPPPSVTKTPSGTEAIGKTAKPAPGAPATPRPKARKQLDRPGNAASGVSKKTSKSSLPKLDEKNLGLGCAQP
jgi:hypothetical protein